MVKTRNSTRGRKKKRSVAQVSKSCPKKNHSSKQKAPKSNSEISETVPKTKSPCYSSPDTSPFKGFKNTTDEQIKKPKLFASLFSDDDVLPEAKDDVFDRLVNEDIPTNLHRNMRTYSNKKKEKQLKENTVLEFQDCKNREEVLQWLNDTRNVFDRLTQTQNECVVNSGIGTQMTLDMPSVSQQITPRVNGPKREMQKTFQNPYKLRARSLDIQIKKNLEKARNRSHSLAGDTGDIENYHIEEVITDEDAPVSAKNNMIIVDLMEEEYLDNIEREIEQNDGKKNHSLGGWDRIKDISRTLSNTKKQPKQLKIMLESSGSKKSAKILNNNVTCYDYDVLENYFIENMEKLLQDEKDRSDRCNTSKVSNSGKFSVNNAVQVGKNFLTVMKKVVENEGRECLREFQPVISELKKLFHIPVKESATQTCNIQIFDKQVQTEKTTVNMAIQTQINLIHANVQTEDNEGILKKNVQIVADIVKAEMQSEDVRKNCKQSFSAASTTPSDIFEDERERQEMQKVFDLDFENEKGVNTIEEIKPKNEIFDDDFNFDFNTEDLLENEPKLAKDEDKQIEGSKTGESVLVVSTECRTEKKGVKRQSESPVYSEDFPRKRPCAKFMREDLSVAFSSCVGNEDRNDRIETNKFIQFSEESDDINYSKCIMKLLDKYENSSCENTKIEPKARTQEQIEELENMIQIATESRPLEFQKNIPPHEFFSKLEDDMDYFKPASYISSDEKRPKTRRNLFTSKKDEVRTSPNVFSESLFDNDRNITVVQNRTITQSNMDAILEEHRKTIDDNDADKEVHDIFKDKKTKINILENVLLRGGENSVAKNDGYSSETNEVLSDVDVVESTPQKKFPSVDKGREESILDVTLPPPLEFQDSEKASLGHDTSKVLDVQRINISPRRPLAVINKITSTPITQKHDSEFFLSLSPISCHRPKQQLSPVQIKSKFEQFSKKAISSRENNRNPGFFELGQQQTSKFSALTVVRKPQSQEFCRLTVSPKQKSILNYVRSSQECQQSPKSQISDSDESLGKRKPCIACSRVSRDQVIAISTLTNKKLATYSTSFSPKVTHLIVATNERNCLKDHTIKFVSAVAAGIWVLNFEWIQECLSKNMLVCEEPFEVLDVSGLPGPRQARLTRRTNPLFKGYKIHAATPFVSTTQQEIENVVKMLGGKVVPSPEHLLDKNGYVCVIVTEARATQDFELYETWLEALKVLTVDIEWLSRSVGQYKLLSLRPFTLCSDDGIESLGYPPELTVNMTYSFSQQTFNSVPSST